MNSSTNYPYLDYEPNRIASSIVAAVTGCSLIAWLVQSIHSNFQPLRLISLILVSHVTIVLELILRAALSKDAMAARFVNAFMTALLTIGQRLLILANYEFLVQTRGMQSFGFKIIRFGSFLNIVISAILLVVAGMVAHNSSSIDTSFLLRQIAAAIIVGMTILFFPIWLATKIVQDMTKKGNLLMAISGLACLIAAMFTLVISIPEYYFVANRNEFWMYIFQIMEIVLAQITWTLFHPTRSLRVIN